MVARMVAISDSLRILLSFAPIVKPLVQLCERFLSLLLGPYGRATEPKRKVRRY